MKIFLRISTVFLLNCPFHAQANEINIICNEENVYSERALTKNKILLAEFNTSCKGLYGVSFGIQPKNVKLETVPDTVIHLPINVQLQFVDKYNNTEHITEKREIETGYSARGDYILSEIVPPNMKSGSIYLIIESSDLLYEYFDSVYASIGPTYEIY